MIIIIIYFSGTANNRKVTVTKKILFGVLMSAHIHLPQIFLEAVGQIYFENDVLLFVIIVCVQSFFILIPFLIERTSSVTLSNTCSFTSAYIP